jgi:hypothetical protein
MDDHLHSGATHVYLLTPTVHLNGSVTPVPLPPCGMFSPECRHGTLFREHWALSWVMGVPIRRENA